MPATGQVLPFARTGPPSIADTRGRVPVYFRVSYCRRQVANPLVKDRLVAISVGAVGTLENHILKPHSPGIDKERSHRHGIAVRKIVV